MNGSSLAEQVSLASALSLPARAKLRAVRAAPRGSPGVYCGAFVILRPSPEQKPSIASLPTRIGRYRQFARTFPADGVRIVIRVDRETAHQADATIEFVDHRGRLVARIEGYECVIDASLNEAFLRKELAAPAGA